MKHPSRPGEFPVCPNTCQSVGCWFGAHFTLQVDYPLMPAPAEEKKEEEKPEAASEWEAAKREVYGTTQKEARRRQAYTVQLSGGPKQEYEPERVDSLIAKVLEALANAANIRGLKDGDAVAVTVFGSAHPFPSAVTSSALGGAPASDAEDAPEDARTLRKYLVVEDGVVVETTGGRLEAERFAMALRGSARTTVLTIRAAKGAIDSFARGAKSFEEFRKEAQIASYLGAASDPPGVMLPYGGRGTGR